MHGDLEVRVLSALRDNDVLVGLDDLVTALRQAQVVLTPVPVRSIQPALPLNGAREGVKDLVREALRVRPMTDGELIDLLGFPANSVRPRRVDLVKDGEVWWDGLMRRTPSGHQAKVWRLTLTGEAA